MKIEADAAMKIQADFARQRFVSSFASPGQGLSRTKKRGRPGCERPKSREETPKVGYDRQA
jgi:hypothetical protein